VLTIKIANDVASQPRHGKRAAPHTSFSGPAFHSQHIVSRFSNVSHDYSSRYASPRRSSKKDGTTFVGSAMTSTPVRVMRDEHCLPSPRFRRASPHTRRLSRMMMTQEVDLSNVGLSVVTKKIMLLLVPACTHTHTGAQTCTVAPSFLSPCKRILPAPRLPPHDNATCFRTGLFCTTTREMVLVCRTFLSKGCADEMPAG
jgi:hypothetical protein